MWMLVWRDGDGEDDVDVGEEDVGEDDDDGEDVDDDDVIE